MNTFNKLEVPIDFDTNTRAPAAVKAPATVGNSFWARLLKRMTVHAERQAIKRLQVAHPSIWEEIQAASDRTEVEKTQRSQESSGKERAA